MKVDQWASEIQEWCSESQVALSAQVGAKARAVYKRIIDYSPSPDNPIARFSVGHFIHNWRLGNSAQAGEIGGTETSDVAKARIDAFIDDEYFLVNEKVTMTNSTEYVDAIEYLGWPSGKVPYAPVARAIADNLE